MKVLCWNIRGLGSPSKRATIKSLIFSYDPDFVILTESKISNLQLLNKNILWNKPGIHWHALPSTGSSGSIIVLWDDTKFKVNNIKVGSHSISINVLSTNGNWWLTSVYGPYKNNDRTNLWLELELLQTLCLPNWLITRDFNIVRWETETNAKSLDRRNMTNFNNFISVNELIDPPL